MRATVVAAFVALAPLAASAHSTPPVRLSTEREATVRLIGGASRYFTREVRLSAEERETIRRRTGWNASAGAYRFYLGRGPDGAALASAVFLTDYTVHGPVRVGAALAPDGTVKGAMVIEVSEEAYSWVKPLLDSGFLDRFAGADAGTAASAGDGVENTMQRFYARVIAGLVARAAVLCDVAGLMRRAG